MTAGLEPLRRYGAPRTSTEPHAADVLDLRVDRAISSMASPSLCAGADIVTALHACDTATDDAIRFALSAKARIIVLSPCCQAEVAAVLRCLELESHGYHATVTERVGWGHSMKNELSIASLDKDVARRRAAETIAALLGEPGPTSLLERFFNGLGRSSSPSGSVPAA
jgi:hypothetical protein